MYCKQNGASTMASIQEINRTIVSGVFTNDELSSTIEAIKFARNQMTRKNTGSLVVGSRVKFTNSKNGMVYRGTVNKVKQKFILVNTDNGPVYNVPAAMLSPE